MTSEVQSITLSEWQTLGPDNCQQLRGKFVGDAADCRRVMNSLNKSRMLGLTELRDGLQISAYSHVGRVRLGNLNITVLPKLNAKSLLRLLRYAFGFRRLELVSDSTHLVDECGFEDLLISQLNAEVQELVSRGLQRSYVRQDEWLSSPRGRFNIDQLALRGGTITASLPCQHHPRIEDTFLNRVLKSGLRLAGAMASLVDLRRDSRRLVTSMEEQVSDIRIDARVLDQAARQMTRLTQSYVPALSIIRLLVEAKGIVLEGKATTSTLPGFLFDMNLFFQALLSRFLKENLPGYVVKDEHGLKGMMKYRTGFNPRNRRSPTPRPDFAVMKHGNLVALLDAKYRDLWEKSLPREMLYQLVVYAISQRQRPVSSMLYPTLDESAREARIDVSDPVFGKHIGQVSLRPVNLLRLEKLVLRESVSNIRIRQEDALRLAFGGSESAAI